MIQIEITKEAVNLYKDDKESPIYSIRKAELSLTRKEGKFEISEWIAHLIFKSWMEADILYELAVLIQKEFPENNINWEETFFPVEKKQYLNHVRQTKDIILDSKESKSSFKSLTEKVETGMEEQNEFVNSQVLKIVKMNLKKHKLI